MKTLGEILKLTTAHLQERKIAHPRRSSEELLAHLLQLSRMDLYLQFERPLLEEELARFREMVKRRGKGEPVEYITGEVEFLGCQLLVDARVLIPRQETEILAEKIVKRVQKGILWDICTGSGCLGIAIKKAVSELTVVLSDLSQGACEVAAENAKRNGVEVEILQGDLLAPFSGRRADYVVCNPPYVAEGDLVDSSVRDFEPEMALMGGASFYERLARELPDFLNPGAQVFFEIGATQAEVVKQIFSGDAWTKQELLTDWAGLDRFFFLEKRKIIE